MNCKGQDTRIRIVNEYYVEPIAHIRLISGKVIEGDAGKKIKNSYYIFECKHKTTGKEEVIQCGSGAAREILTLIGKKPPKKFNPLEDDNDAGDVDNYVDNDGNGLANNEWNPAAKQLYNAIMLLIVAWDAKAGTPLFKMKIEAEKYYKFEPYIYRIKPINNILKRKGITIRNIIEKLSEENNLREYHFNLLSDKLEQHGEESFLGD